jgi:ribosomal peptide maturation radical SAM protein 1
VYIDSMARRIVGGGYDIVGFTATYFQTQASVALARRIKQLAPRTIVILGGASATDAMGAAILKAFPVVDLVCHTEAEEIIEAIVRSLRGEPGFSLDAIGGISYRSADGGLVDRSSAEAPWPHLDDVPLPDFDDYFEDAHAFTQRVEQRIALPLELPVETSRGCWWGEKSHCTFCGLNSNRMRFRGKSPEAAAETILALYRRYRCPHFFAVDTIIDYRYFGSFCRTLKEADEPLHLSYEVKANLKKSDIKALASAGVTWVQPGFESLSTRVLQSLMKKGTTALQNVQTLKWLAEHGILVRWNLFPAYPGDRVSDYEHVPQWLRLLRHLPAPDYNRLQVQRFSPQHTHPEANGIKIVGVQTGWKFAFHDVAPDVLMDLTYMFDWEEPNRDDGVEKFAESSVRPLVAEWKKHQATEGCTLSILYGIGEAAVIHGRLESPARIVRYGGAAAFILRAADGIRSAARVLETLAQAGSEPADSLDVASLDQQSFDFFLGRWRKAGVTIEEATPGGSHHEVVDRLVSAGLLIREGGSVLTLPVNCALKLQSDALRRDPAALLAHLMSASAESSRVATSDAIAVA